MSYHPGRRQLLRGLGIALALPWLESVHADEPQQAQPPKRLIVTTFSNGVFPEDWWVKGTHGQGAGMQFGPALTALAPFASRLNFYNGLRHEALISVGNVDLHHSREPSVLCGKPVGKSHTRLKLGVTFDQIVARHCGRTTPLSSLVLGGQYGVNGVKENYSSAYINNVSWNSESTPVPKIVDPNKAFARVFKRSSENAARYTSVLDAVRDDARSLMQSISANDRQRLQSYQDHLRSIEQRLQRQAQPPERSADAWQPFQPDAETLHGPAYQAEPGKANSGEEVLKRWHLLQDIAILALRCDHTRVISFMYGNSRCETNWSSFIPKHHNNHYWSHRAASPVYRDYITWQTKQFALFLEKLQACDESNGPLLDNSMVVYVSGHGKAAHGPQNLPCLTVGSGGGALATGQVHDYTNSKSRQLNRLYLSLIRAMGVDQRHYNDAQEPLFS